MKKLKNDNKGFTLVELIVVLVILAILAAILVPALLGYIDEARNKQLQIHGKSVYTAAQSKASQAYGKNTKIQSKTKDTGATDEPFKIFGKDVAKLAELGSFSPNSTANAYVAFEGTEGKKYYTIKDIVYSEDGDSTGVRMLGKDGKGTEPWEYITGEGEDTVSAQVGKMKEKYKVIKISWASGATEATVTSENL